MIKRESCIFLRPQIWKAFSRKTQSSATILNIVILDIVILDIVILKNLKVKPPYNPDRCGSSYNGFFLSPQEKILHYKFCTRVKRLRRNQEVNLMKTGTSKNTAMRNMQKNTATKNTKSTATKNTKSTVMRSHTESTAMKNLQRNMARIRRNTSIKTKNEM